MTALPGTPVDIPLPPALTETLGYAGDARFVGFRWSSLGDQLVFENGCGSGTAQSWAWLAYKRHRAVAPLLRGFDLGSSEEDGTHVLLIDREGQRASVAPAGEARAFLAAQHPPREPLTPEQQEAFQAELERLLEEWRNSPVDHDAFARQMAEQRARMGRMLSWLDMAPVPGQGEGPVP